MAPEKHQAPALVVGDPFVVDQLAALFHHAFEHGHVVGLPFDGVGPEREEKGKKIKFRDDH